MSLELPKPVAAYFAAENAADARGLARCFVPDGVVHRFVYQQVPPKVEYSLTDWGQALCPALDALLKWVDLKGALIGGLQHIKTKSDP